MKHLKTLLHPSHLFADLRGLVQKGMYWTPRMIGIFSILFLGLFALDAFIPERSWGENLLAFLMHLIPNILLVILLILAWKHQRLGGILYIALGICFSLFFKNSWMINLMLFGPLLLTGVLFFLSTFYLKNVQK